MLKILKCSHTHVIIRNYAKKKTLKEMKYLNVAEKHDAAKTIAGLLSNGTARRREGYSVYNKIFDFDASVQGRNSKMVMTSVSGHLLQLAFPISYRNWNNIDPQTLFDAPVRKTCSQDFEPIKRTLEREIRGCNGLIIWTDCDREGENIGFEIIEVCRAIKSNITVYRAIFSEITTPAVRRALAKLAQPDQRSSDAVDVRTELDLRTGAAITRFQTLRLTRLFPEKMADKLISYGSCQIPTMGFVAERYKEIEAFVSEAFWKIKVSHTIDDLTVDFNWARNRLFDKQACEDYLLLCLADPKATVELVTVKPKHKWRPTPMDTVEMEKLGSRKLKLSAKETMTIAEKLYTKGIISYPRTETNQFSKEFDLRSLVEQHTSHGQWGEFAQRVLEWGPNPRNGNKSDQAHPPIHPTKFVPNLDGNEARVYELICRHFLACVSKDAVGSETIVHINIAGEKFTATGLCIYERNYLDVYIYEKWNAKQIHRYEEGQVFEPTDISMQEGATTAPPLLTEADLIALMEKHGIGTDATHAEHINTIKERGYIGVVDNGSLVPGVIGMGLYEGYNAMELALAKPVLRAEFEADLKKICLGQKEPKLVLREQIQKYKEAYGQIREKITAMDAKMAERINETPTLNTADSTTNTDVSGTLNNNFENNPNRVQELFQCPKCSTAALALKQKKNQTGYFIGCLLFPDCKNVIWLPEECKEPSVLAETCITCGADIKLLKFKFTTAYHKAMFNAPHGWYKTCLRCDAKFRETFNINLENVKRLGAIVNNTEHTSRAAASNTRPASNNNLIARNNATTTRGGVTQVNRQAKTASGEPKTKVTRKKKTSIENNTNIRSYFTTAAATSVNNAEQSSAEIVAAELNGVPLDAFFDSNDSFDNVLLEAEANMLSATDATAHNNAHNTQRVPSNELSADIAAAFANDDLDDEEYQWGTRLNSNVNTSSNIRTATPDINSQQAQSSAVQNNAYFDDSFSALLRDNDDLEDYAWGTAEHNRRKSQSNNASQTAKKPRLQETTNYNQFDDAADDNDISWTRNHNTSPTPTLSKTIHSTEQHNVKCTGCHQLAKLLTVKKDGPNKGRPFYGCPKANSACKFFQWADEVPQTTNTTQTSSHNSNTNKYTETSQTASSRKDWGTAANKNVSTNSLAVVKCNCGTLANSLTVRKEGPNKGRPFFNCANRDKSCGFFKWADENESEASTSTGVRSSAQSNYSWGSSGRSGVGNTSNFTAVKNQQPQATGSNEQRENNKKRKCGLCRQEGHTRQKCPRKSEFEF